MTNESELELILNLAATIKAHTTDRQKQLLILDEIDLELYEIDESI